MKQLLFIFLLLFGFSKTGLGQTGFAIDSTWNPPYICQASAFDLEAFGMVASYSTQYGSQNYYVSHDTIYVQFHFVGGVGPAVPYPLYRKINILAPLNFGIYKIVVQGIGNGQVLQTLTSAVSICSGMLAVPEKIRKEPELSIYPNPAHNLVQVKLPFPAQSSALKLIDVAGKTILAVEFSGQTETQLNLQNLPAGLYLLEVSTSGKIFTQKVIKL